MTRGAFAQPKLSHAAGERSGREAKARRIEVLLAKAGVSIDGATLLDIGTGSGTIASYFAKRARRVLSVDVVDERVDHDFDFQHVDSETLPCETGTVDIILSNHVIEHVDDQGAHLREIARVLRPGGVCYLATPNRLWPVEPHFALPFLAWLPSRRLQDAYVRLTRRGARYDARLVTAIGLARKARVAGLRCRDMSYEMADAVVASKLRAGLGPLRPLWPALAPLAPSLVVLLSPESEVG